jgi:anti-sigma factor RsiW
MACDAWRAKLDAYLDGELAPAESRELSTHMRTCPSCAADALERVQLKRSIAMAGKRYEPSAQFRAKVAEIISAKPQRRLGWFWKLAVASAFVVVIVSLTTLYLGRANARRQRMYSELADLHVAALASSTPVDVVSSDRHTVKPWFQGKIPFSFNLPELAGTEFSLVGGRVTYLGQTPGAHLIYQVRKHEISVFIFQDREPDRASFRSGPVHELSFNIETWTQNGLRYFVVGDVNSDDIKALSKRLRDAGST